MRVQERIGGSPWRDSFEAVTVEPLAAFAVQDRDVVWFRAPARGRGGSARDALVWAELSLQRNARRVHQQAEGAGLASRQRKVSATKFEPATRRAEEAEADRAMLRELLDAPDPMTRQDVANMKDIWNKCLGWISMTGEHFTESLFLRCPGENIQGSCYHYFVEWDTASIDLLCALQSLYCIQSHGA